jgi:hypothetical protein
MIPVAVTVEAFTVTLFCPTAITTAPAEACPQIAGDAELAQIVLVNKLAHLFLTCVLKSIRDGAPQSAATVHPDRFPHT